jgi:hypothetical protein
MEQELVTKQDDKHIELTAQEAREGETSGHVRWVLRISLALSIIAGVVIYLSLFRL